MLLIPKSVQKIFQSNGTNSPGDKFQILETEVNLGDFCEKDISARQFFRQEVDPIVQNLLD